MSPRPALRKASRRRAEGQFGTAAEGAFTDCSKAGRQPQLPQTRTAGKGTLSDQKHTIRQRQLRQVPAAVESPPPDRREAGREIDLSQIAAVTEGPVADCSDSRRDFDLSQAVAARSDYREVRSSRDGSSRGRPQRRVLSDMAGTRTSSACGSAGRHCRRFRARFSQLRSTT